MQYWVRVMAGSGKCFPQKQQDQVEVPSTHVKNGHSGGHLKYQQWGGEDRRIPGLCWPVSQMGKLQIQWGTLSQKIKESNCGRHPALTSGLHVRTRAHTPVHTRAPVYMNVHTYLHTAHTYSYEFTCKNTKWKKMCSTRKFWLYEIILFRFLLK